VKYNKLIVLALAGLTLAVMTSGNALASTTWNYNGVLASTWNLNTPTFSNPPSYGEYDSAKVGDDLAWQNTLTNSYSHDAAGWGSYSNAGLSWDGTSWSSNPTTVKAGTSTPQRVILLRITSAASSPIYAYHDYTYNQNVYSSAFSTQMIYTATN
jgi:hypothetical protein